jgi:hypothetical protein
MAHHALAAVEAALRARKLDGTLTTARLPHDSVPAVAPTGVERLDACLRGGLPRGQLSEITGPRSSGRMTLLLGVLAAATRRGEIAALVDTFDSLDVESIVSTGVAPDRLLWIRGAPGLSAPPNGHVLDRTLDRALKALNLVLQAGGFGVVVLDMAEAPRRALSRIPFTTWLRVQRAIEGSETACILAGPQPLARSAGGLTLSLAGQPHWEGAAPRSRRLAGIDIAVRVISPRRRMEGEVTIAAGVRSVRLQPD